MRVAGVALELLEHGVAEWAFWQHAFDSVLEHTVRILVLQFLEIRFRNAAGVAGVTKVRLLEGFVASDAKFFHISHDDEIARVHVRREDRLVFAAKAGRDL